MELILPMHKNDDGHFLHVTGRMLGYSYTAEASVIPKLDIEFLVTDMKYTKEQTPTTILPLNSYLTREEKPDMWAVIRGSTALTLDIGSEPVHEVGDIELKKIETNAILKATFYVTKIFPDETSAAAHVMEKKMKGERY